MMQSVQVIIERLKTNPEDFFGDADSRGRIPKFSSILDKLDNLLTETQDGHVHRLWFLEPEEKAALIEAYKEARRTRFEAQVFHDLLTPREENYGVDLTVRSHPMSGKIMMQGSGWTDPRAAGAQVQIIKDEEKVYAKNRNPRP